MGDESPRSYILLKDGRLLDITPLEENLNPLQLVASEEWEEAENITIEDIMEAEELSAADAKAIIARGEAGEDRRPSFSLSDDEEEELDEDMEEEKDEFIVEEEDEDEDSDDILCGGDEEEDESDY